MKRRNFAPYLGMTLVLASGMAACSSNRGAGPTANLPGGTPVSSAAVTARGTLNVVIPKSLKRHLEYVSAGTAHAAIFINGAAAAAGSSSTCVPGNCTVNWTFSGAVPASYSFAVEVDNGAGGGSKILAEGGTTQVITPGVNANFTVTLNGVVANASIPATVSPAPTELCTGATCSGTLTLADAAGDAITNTTTPLSPSYDNGSITFGISSASPAPTPQVSPGTISSPSSDGTYTYSITCVGTTGAYMTQISPASTTGSGTVTSAEQAALSLSYPASIAYATHTYICGPGPSIRNHFTVSILTTPGDGTFVVPANVTTLLQVDALGSGASGASANGGGGGAFSRVINLTVNPGDSLAYHIDGSNGHGASYFCNSTSNCASIAGTAVVVGANSGNGTTGGSTTGAVGSVKFAGGAGGLGSGAGAGGGGGAGGPNGAGGGGGAAGGNFGGGGGGAGSGDGTASNSGQSGGIGTSSTSGNGGNNAGGTGSGPGSSTSGVAATAGTNGGGGGGASSANGGAGGGGAGGYTLGGITFYSGGGGGGSAKSGNAGVGGSFGGGGGGTKSGTNGAGAQGVVVVSY